MRIYLTVDFGSTFTKLTAVDMENQKILGTSKSFTTIETDVREGFDKALKLLEDQLGNVNYEKIYASSSAAGGLKMISVGLVPDLTAKASRLAATSAGAKVLKTYSYELSHQEQLEIEEINPDIILLTGGIDGGNKDVILHNAKMLAEVPGVFSVIVAGNKSVSEEVGEILEKAGKRVKITENVMPVFNKLNIEPAKEAIRELFIENIVSAKGLDEVQKMMSAEIVPTPLAVFNAGFLLSRGTKTADGLKEIMMYDVGGATTDVYSMSSGRPTKPNVFIQGITEPFAKRTVEGDIGMRYSILSLMEAATYEMVAANIDATVEEVEDWVTRCKKSPDILPQKGTIEQKIDEEIGSFAIEISAQRHCGFTETIFSPIGEVLLQTGKDLTKVEYVIGSGGSVIHSQNPRHVLARAAYSPKDLTYLKPLNPKFMLDKKNILAAMGLLSEIEPDTALKIMLDELVEI